MTRLLAIGVATAAAVAACSSGGAKPAGTGRTALQSTTTATSRDQTAAAILSQWLAAEKVITASSKDPGGQEELLLTDFLVDPQLSFLRTQLDANARDGLVDIGDFDPGKPKLENLNGSEALVISCATNRLQLVHSKTGQPVPGKAGDATPTLNGIRSTMMLTPGGIWKLSKSDVEDGSCAGL
jgi:hypothetical protein